MKTFIVELLFIFSKKEKAIIALLFLAVLGASVVEGVGIAAILPFVTMLSNPKVLGENPYLAQLYDWLSPASFSEFFVIVTLAMIGIFLLKNAYLFTIVFASSKFLYGKCHRLSRDLYTSYMLSPYVFHLKVNSAQLLRNLNNAISVLQGIMLPVVTIVSEASIILIIVALLVWIEPEATLLIMTVLGAGMGLFYLFLHKKLRDMGYVLQHSSAKVIQQVNQGLGSIKETKILGREDYFIKQYADHLKDQFDALHVHQVSSQSPRFVIETLSISMIFIVVIYYFLNGKDSQSIVAILSLLGVSAFRMIPSMIRISSAMTDIRLRLPALHETYQGLRSSHVSGNALPVAAPGREQIPRLSQRIELKEVTYSYEEAEKPALRNVTLEMPFRTTVGLVGHSGAGKSTLVDIILGLLQPTSGAVLVDGQNIHHCLRGWQEQIGYVPQSIYLMDDTIRANITFAEDDGEGDAKVWQALRLAQLEQFVRSLPSGLDTEVGESGVRLSGGQRQRIGIARALYRNPEVLILDEATAALDNETESAIVESIRRLGAKKTIILIAHRLSTVRYCDIIYFLSQGEVKAFGNYDELMDSSPEFKKMATISASQI